MWPFSKSGGNRRLGRRELLEVKGRSDVARKRRLRWGAVALAFASGTALVVCLAWQLVSWSLEKLFYQNSTYAISRIEVHTDGVILPEQIRQWSGVRQGQNLLALNLAELKRNLELVPYIRMAAVERVLPRTLRIRVSEREPLAVVYVPRLRPGGGAEMDALFLDEEGYVLAPLDKSQCANPEVWSAARYPVVLGIDPAELKPGKRIDLDVHRGVKAALELIVAFDRSPMVGLDSLQRIDTSSPGVLEVVTEQGSQVTFGTTDLARQLRRLAAIYELGQRLGRALGSVDLAVSDNIPVRWAVTRPVPAQPAQRQDNPQRRRNV
ncbi:MAG: FtsQ-type POTRA domain-containing protein [Verrucomicrobiae bacterium]|nr:FtsQ-type POTRA domain-containing protein [Verrucomicrobiae bacterium]MDW7979448.1 FtsQ-type POTRA domain-containing protein [Verrucomicrobiales bacterium]